MAEPSDDWALQTILAQLREMEQNAQAPAIIPPPTVDPTLNVTAQLEAAIKRQDDLRLQEAAHVRELLELRGTFYEELRKAESSRIDAIRAVDVGSVTRAAEVSAVQAATLATQVATSAETLRGQVQAAASATAAALATALGPITKSIEDLRQAQYQQQGERFQRTEGRDTNQWVIGTIIAAAVAFASITSLVLYITLHR